MCLVACAPFRYATHRVMRTESGLEQFELVEDENAKIFRMGFSVAEVEEMLKNE